VKQRKHIKPIKTKGLTTQHWFDVFTLYHCCVVSPFSFIGLMCLLCITVVLLVLLFLLVWCVYFVNSETKKTHQTNKNKRTNNTTVKQSKHIKPIKTKGLTTQQWNKENTSNWFDVFTLYHCCVVSPFVFIGLMCLLCITVVLFVLLFLFVWCVYFVSLLCC
jgi:Flp pilus assembly protein TadB